LECIEDLGRLSGSTQKHHSDEGDYAEEEILTLEHQLAQFYMQSFFNRFGQGAVIPHCVNEGS